MHSRDREEIITEVIRRRRELQEKEDLDKLLDSTKKYYENYSEKYVDFYNKWIKGEGNFSNPDYKEGYDQLAETLNEVVESGEMVIDIGCGVGTWSSLFAKNRANVISLDYSSSVLRKCGEKAKSLGLNFRVFRVLADGFHLPFSNKIFNGATLNWVLAHIQVNRNYLFLKEVGRVLRDNGWLVVSDSYWRGQEGGKEQVHVRIFDKGTYEVYKYYYTQRELRNLLQKALGIVERLWTTRYEMICIARKDEHASTLVNLKR